MNLVKQASKDSGLAIVVSPFICNLNFESRELNKPGVISRLFWEIRLYHSCWILNALNRASNMLSTQNYRTNEQMGKTLLTCIASC